MINTGQAKSEADLARKLGISRVRVNQIVSVLKLAPQIITQIERLGDPLLSRIVTERMLRSYVGQPFKKQEKLLHRIQ